MEAPLRKFAHMSYDMWKKEKRKQSKHEIYYVLAYGSVDLFVRFIWWSNFTGKSI